MVYGTSMLVGYARVSTLDQNPQLQIDALKQAGCERLYVEKASGAHRDRPELKAAIEYMRPGDTLVVWRLSRLARSLKQIIETAHELEQKKQALKVLTRNIDTGTSEGRLFFHIPAAFDEFGVTTRSVQNCTLRRVSGRFRERVAPLAWWQQVCSARR